MYLQAYLYISVRCSCTASERLSVPEKLWTEKAMQFTSSSFTNANHPCPPETSEQFAFWCSGRQLTSSSICRESVLTLGLNPTTILPSIIYLLCVFVSQWVSLQCVFPEREGHLSLWFLNIYQISVGNTLQISLHLFVYTWYVRLVFISTRFVARLFCRNFFRNPGTFLEALPSFSL